VRGPIAAALGLACWLSPAWAGCPSKNCTELFPRPLEPIVQCFGERAALRLVIEEQAAEISPAPGRPRPGRVCRHAGRPGPAGEAQALQAGQDQEQGRAVRAVEMMFLAGLCLSLGVMVGSPYMIWAAGIFLMFHGLAHVKQ